MVANVTDIKALRWNQWVSDANEALGIRSRMSWVLGDIALQVIGDESLGENRVHDFCREIRDTSIRTLYERAQMSAFYPLPVRNRVDNDLFRYSFWRFCMRWSKKANAIDESIDAQEYAMQLLDKFADDIDRYTPAFCTKLYARWKRRYDVDSAPSRNIVHRGNYTRSQLRDIVNRLDIGNYAVTIERLTP